MSALPEGERNQPAKNETRLATGEAAATLVEALQVQADVQRRLRDANLRLEAARAAGAEDTLFLWQADADREAEMRVYFHRQEELDVLACQLERLDDRLPTAAERVRLEEEFEAELQTGGDLWMEIVSYIGELGTTDI